MMAITCFVYYTNQKAVSKGNKKNNSNTFLNPLQILKKIYHLEKHQRKIKQYTEKNYNILMLKNRKNQIIKFNQFSGHSKNTRECTQKLKGKKYSQ